MPFQKGNKYGKHGRQNPPGGRPTKTQQEIKKAAKEIAQEYIETHIKPIMDTYLALAAGKVVERKTSKGKKQFVLEVDPSTTRDAVGKLLPAAKQTIAIEGGTIDSLIAKLSEAKRNVRNG
jgi:hypothetical protein